ncbi:ABC-type amino acid transport substrate-binding protein [Labrenzia sp. EL_126]|nr:ABC-type amino acid transport substrate-binding protein [Labrenzia sp. EL_126]
MFARVRYSLQTGVVLALILVASTSDTLHARPLNDIIESGEIRFCVAPIHPSIASAAPPVCKTDCKLSGPVVEEARAFAASLGENMKAKFVTIGWDEQFHDQRGITDRASDAAPRLLENGTCDIYPSHLTITDWRLRMMDIVPLFNSRMMVIVDKGRQEDFKMPADLAGKSTAAEKDTSFHSWIQAQNEGKFSDNPILVELLSSEEVFQSLDDNRIDFVLTDANAAIWSIRHTLNNAAVAFPVGEDEQIGWGVSKSDKALQKKIETYFAEQKSSNTSTYNRIWEDHFGVSLTRFENLLNSLSQLPR